MLAIARDLGAEVITMADNDFVDAVLRVAAARNITQIVTGKTDEAWWRRPLIREPRFAKLARLSGGIDVHVASLVRPGSPGAAVGLGVGRGEQWQWLAAMVATAGVLGLGFLIQPMMPQTTASLLSSAHDRWSGSFP